jgi:hypothetical protein
LGEKTTTIGNIINAVQKYKAAENTKGEEFLAPILSRDVVNAQSAATIIINRDDWVLIIDNKGAK